MISTHLGDSRIRRVPELDMYCGTTMCEWGIFSMMLYYSFLEENVN
jgi:hypothetical protein